MPKRATNRREDIKQLAARAAAQAISLHNKAHELYEKADKLHKDIDKVHGKADKVHATVDDLHSVTAPTAVLPHRRGGLKAARAKTKRGNAGTSNAISCE